MLSLRRMEVVWVDAYCSLIEERETMKNPEGECFRCQYAQFSHGLFVEDLRNWV
jgi:hypothetical protein